LEAGFEDDAVCGLLLSLLLVFVPDDDMIPVFLADDAVTAKTLIEA
jgi:hypothetical protein